MLLIGKSSPLLGNLRGEDEAGGMQKLGDSRGYNRDGVVACYWQYRDGFAYPGRVGGLGHVRGGN